MYSHIQITGSNPQNVNALQSVLWNIYTNSPTFRTILDNVSSRYPNIIIDVTTGNGYHTGTDPATGALAPYFIGARSGQDLTNQNTFKIFLDPSLQQIVIDTSTLQQRPATLEEIIAHEFSHAQHSGSPNVFSLVYDPSIEPAVRLETNVISTELGAHGFSYPSVTHPPYGVFVQGQPIPLMDGSTPLATDLPTGQNPITSIGDHADTLVTGDLKFGGLSTPAFSELTIDTRDLVGALTDTQSDFNHDGRVDSDQKFAADHSSVLSLYGYTAANLKFLDDQKTFNTAGTLTFDKDGAADGSHIDTLYGVTVSNITFVDDVKTYASNALGGRLATDNDFNADSSHVLSLYGYTAANLQFVDDQKSFNSGNQLLSDRDAAADGSYKWIAYDPGNASNWSSYTNNYNTTGIITTQTGNYDDARSWANTYDSASHLASQSFFDTATRLDAQTYFTASGAIDYQSNYDDFNKLTYYYDFDQANAYNWTSYSSNFANGIISSQTGHYDDARDWGNYYNSTGGQATSYTYDAAHRVDTIYSFDTAGRADSMNAYDDNSIIDYQYGWDDSSRVDYFFDFDTAGRIDNRYYYDDLNQLHSRGLYDDAQRVDKTWAYDAAGRLDYSYTYDDASHRDRGWFFDDGNHVERAWIFDNANRVDSQRFYDDAGRTDWFKTYDDSNRTDYYYKYDDFSRMDWLFHFTDANLKDFAIAYDDANRIDDYYYYNSSGSLYAVDHYNDAGTKTSQTQYSTNTGYVTAQVDFVGSSGSFEFNFNFLF